MTLPSPSPTRDLRIDFFRGVALVMIFINHLPTSLAGIVTLRAWGFSDSAEVFVLLAGMAAALAYARRFETGGFMQGARAVIARIRTLYLTHLALLLAVGVLSIFAAQNLGETTYYEQLGFAAFVEEPLRRLPDALALMFQPVYLDILPLYIVLLALVPALMVLARAHRLLPLAGAIALYAASFFWPLHLPNNLRDGGIWFFNPFAWQLLFVIGFTLGLMLRDPAGLPAPPRALRHGLTAFAVLYTLLAIFAVAPWRLLPGFEDLWLVDPNLLAVANKSMLHPLRLVDILTKLWLVSVLVPAGARWLETAPMTPLVLMGRHSLKVFATSTVMAVAGGMLIENFGAEWLTPAVLAGGLSVMMAIGLGNEALRQRGLRLAEAPSAA